MNRGHGRDDDVDSGNGASEGCSAASNYDVNDEAMSDVKNSIQRKHMCNS